MDFLDEVVRERTARNPKFPGLVKAAEERRRLLRALADERRRSGRTQTEIAAAMGTSQAQVARLEAAESDIRVSTIEKFAAVLGKRIEWSLVDG